MEIIDAQIHDPHPVRPLEASVDNNVRLLLACEMAREAMDSVGVDLALMNAGQELLDFAVARYPDRFAGCGRWDVRTPEVDRWVADYRRRSGMLAVRVDVVHWRTGTPSNAFTEGRIEPLFDAAERHHLPVFASAMGVAKELIPVARAHPELILIIDHFGVASPPPMTLDPDPWSALPGTLALAEFPNVAIKFSGAIALSRTLYPHPDLWPHLHKVISAFGPDRLLWGSDFTRLRMGPGTVERGPREGWAGLYSDSVNFLRDTTEISQRDKAAIFGGTIRRLLRWPDVR